MRLTIPIRIDTQKAHEHELLPVIDDLKATRNFAKGVRVGLKIFWEAMQGRSDTLKAEFPALVESLVNEAVAHALDNQQQHAIEELKTLLLARPVEFRALPAGEGGDPLQPLKAPDQPAKRQSLSDSAVGDLLEVQSAPKTKPTDKKWNVPYCNLQLGLYGLGSIKALTELADEVLEYGIHTGKLPAAKAQKVLNERREKKGKNDVDMPEVAAPEVVPMMQLEGSAKQIAGANVEFAAPTFDDDFDDLL